MPGPFDAFQPNPGGLQRNAPDAAQMPTNYMQNLQPFMPQPPMTPQIGINQAAGAVPQPPAPMPQPGPQGAANSWAQPQQMTSPGSGAAPQGPITPDTGWGRTLPNFPPSGGMTGGVGIPPDLQQRLAPLFKTLGGIAPALGNLGSGPAVQPDLSPQPQQPPQPPSQTTPMPDKMATAMGGAGQGAAPGWSSTWMGGR